MVGDDGSYVSAFNALHLKESEFETKCALNLYGKVTKDEESSITVAGIFETVK